MTSLSLRAPTLILLLLAAPAAGQNSQQPVIITPPMRDFNLPPSGQTPTPQSTEPAPVPLPAPVVSSSATPASGAVPRRSAATRAPSAPQSGPAPQASETAAVGIPMTPAATATPIQSELTPDIAVTPDTGGALPGWFLPALGGILLLVAGGTAGWWFGRRRRREQDEAEKPVALLPPPPASPVPSPGPPPLDRKTLPTPSAAPRVAPPVPPPAGPLLTEMRPLRAAIRDGMVTVDFELFIQNRGGEPADNIRTTLALLGANAQQDEQIANFHAAARMAAGAEPFSLAAGGVYMLSGQVSLPGEQMQVVNVQGKPMFVPIVPVALRWYAGLSIRTLRDVFMVGTAPAPGSDKLGPLWVERAGEGFGRLAAKRYVPKIG